MSRVNSSAELDYMEFLSGVGIEKGDIIDVASDMVNVLMYCRTNGVKLDPNHLIDALKELVGEAGTVMIRTFTWDFCKGVAFDIATSPSRVGALGNTAMKRDDFRRTKHPLYSWMVWGKHADELLEYDPESAFGEGTIFEFLEQHNAKQFILGTTIGDSVTQMHHVEAICEVPYRFNKPFTAQYTDYEGNSSFKTYRMHVRPLNLKVVNEDVDRNERGKQLEDLGIMKVKRLGDNTSVSSLLLNELNEFLVDDMKNNEGKFIVTINDIPGYVKAGYKPEELKYFNE